MKQKKTILLAIFVLLLFFTIGVAGGLVVLFRWTPPCSVADTFNYLSRSCAREQIQDALRTKNLEVIEITDIHAARNNDRQVAFRSRLKHPANDDLANMVFVDSAIFRIAGHRWRLVSSSLHY